MQRHQVCVTIGECGISLLDIDAAALVPLVDTCETHTMGTSSERE